MCPGYKPVFRGTNRMGDIEPRTDATFYYVVLLLPEEQMNRLDIESRICIDELWLTSSIIRINHNLYRLYVDRLKHEQLVISRKQPNEFQ